MQKCFSGLLVCAVFSSLYAEMPPLNVNVHIYNHNQNGLSATVTTGEQPPRISAHALRTLLFGGLITGYLSTMAFVHYSKQILDDSDAWNNWYASLTLEELLAIPHKELYEKLKKSIEAKYQSPSTTITVHATQFLNETAQEIATLRYFVRIGSILRSLHIGRLFLITPEHVKRARANIKRLIYLRTILADEVGSQNLLDKLSIINCTHLKSAA